VSGAWSRDDATEPPPRNFATVGSVDTDMRSRIGLFAVGVTLLAVVGLLAFEMSRLRAERDEARAALGAANSSLMVTNARLGVERQLRDRYTRLANHRRDVVGGLRDQVDWDKSHLLDCWTGLVRVVPSGTMTRIFGRPLGYLAEAARDGGVVAHYVRRCAADAVP
jgi:hypothetical protein